jgi:site-specific recombinase XerD
VIRSGSYVSDRHLVNTLAQTGVSRAPLGLHGHAVPLIVKQRAEAAGLDPAEPSGHILRAGFCTSAAETGASVMKIRETSRHKSIDVLAGYVRRVDLFKDHAGAGFL